MAVDKRYRLYLNGQVYAVGSIHYVSELVREYIVTRNLYGHKAVDFRIEEMARW